MEQSSPRWFSSPFAPPTKWFGAPTGYNTLSQEAGFNRKELTIAYPDRPAASVQSAYAQCTYETSQDRLFRQCMAA